MFETTPELEDLIKHIRVAFIAAGGEVAKINPAELSLAFNGVRATKVETYSHQGDDGVPPFEIHTLGYMKSGAAVEIVVIEGNYPAHIHDRASGIFDIIKGSGFVALDGNLVEYREGSRIAVPAGTAHGFMTESGPTVFISVQNPPIKKPGEQADFRDASSLYPLPPLPRLVKVSTAHL